jgi:hypothetical protein
MYRVIFGLEAATLSALSGRIKCSLCEDCGWVCESHPARPWEGEHACTCGAAGAPCPWCNVGRIAPDAGGVRRKGFTALAALLSSDHLPAM